MRLVIKAVCLHSICAVILIRKRTRSAYKLEGFDKEWNYVGTKNEATYTNLDPGKYTFLVKGANNDGVWNENPTALEIYILPPFWATWWFRLLFIIALIVISIALLH